MRETTQTALYQFIVDELKALTTNVAKNYSKNILLRQNNPFLAFENSSTEKFMALGRSIDSQLGNRMQNIIFYLTKIRYGNENVPNIINICIDENSNSITTDIYFTNVEFDKKYFYANTNPCQQNVYINADIDIEKAKKILKIKKTSPDILEKVTYTSENVPNEKIEYIKSLNLLKFPVDLLFITKDERNNIIINTFEIKMSGNLDTKNAESNAEEVYRLKQTFSYFYNNNSYFASCYGECSAAVRNEILDKLDDDAILNSVIFWGLVLPIDDELLSFDDFIDLYKRAFKEADLENRIIEL